MSKELTALEAFQLFCKELKIENSEFANTVEEALKRNIELEEENKILKTIRDNFDLWLEPSYRTTLQFLQCCTMTQSEYEKLIEYFGEPRDE